MKFFFKNWQASSDLGKKIKKTKKLWKKTLKFFCQALDFFILYLKNFLPNFILSMPIRRISKDELPSVINNSSLKNVDHPWLCPEGVIGTIRRKNIYDWMKTENHTCSSNRLISNFVIFGTQKCHWFFSKKKNEFWARIVPKLTFGVFSIYIYYKIKNHWNMEYSDFLDT